MVVRPLSKSQPQRELHLSWCIGASGFHEVSGHLIVSWVKVAANLLGAVLELGGVAHGAVVRKLKAAVQAVEKIERLGGELNFNSFSRIESAGKAHVGGGVIGTDSRVAAKARKSVIFGIAVLVGIAHHSSIYGTAAAGGHHTRTLPSFTNCSDKTLTAVEGT